jgi:hypothetical protein
MQYKLIKLYPDSSELGTIRTQSSFVNDFACKDYPEFWEKVVEKEYEIVSVLVRTSERHIERTVDNHDSGGYILSLINCDGNSIHSIKRLSDNVVFTVGDLILRNNTSIRLETIELGSLWMSGVVINKNTKFSGGECLKTLKKAKTPLFKTEDGVYLYKGDKFYFTDGKSFSEGRAMSSDIKSKLKNFSTEEKAKDYIKSKKVLFKSFDGVDLYAGDKYCQITDRFQVVECVAFDENNFDGSLIIFSTKEKAEEYILMNKPFLSLNDFINYQGKTVEQIKKERL